MQLQLYGKVVPFSSWFFNGRNAKLTRYSMLQNFPSYLNSFSKNKFIAEMSKLHCNLELSTESAEVGFVITGHVAKAEKQLSCNACSSNLIGSLTDCLYFLNLSLGKFDCSFCISYRIGVPKLCFTEFACLKSIFCFYSPGCTVHAKILFSQ